MALAQREVEETTVNDGAATQTTRRVADPAVEHDHNKFVAARVIWFIAGVIEVLLALRFLFVLLGANSGNGLVSFIYAVTYPLVVPFFGIFGYHYQAGVANFEVATLVAMAIYALIAWGLARLVTINRRTVE